VTDEQAVALGHEAQKVLDNKAYLFAWQKIEQTLVDQLSVYELGKDRAEYLRQLLASSRKLRQLLERAMQDGKFVAESLKENKRFWQR
jgi:hypothetical protein